MNVTTPFATTPRLLYQWQCCCWYHPTGFVSERVRVWGYIYIQCFSSNQQWLWHRVRSSSQHCGVYTHIKCVLANKPIFVLVIGGDLTCWLREGGRGRERSHKVAAHTHSNNRDEFSSMALSFSLSLTHTYIYTTLLLLRPIYYTPPYNTSLCSRLLIYVCICICMYVCIKEGQNQLLVTLYWWWWWW